MDMRAFGQTEIAQPGLITNPKIQVSDAMTFLTAYSESCQQDESPLVFYGYSLGAAMSIGTYLSFQAQGSRNEQLIGERIKALVVVSPQFGMGDFWYPCWYRPRYGRLLSMINPTWGGFGPLYSMRDRHCEIQYKGPVYAKTLWAV